MKIMVSLKMIITVFCASLLFNFCLARPRAPQSSRFPQFSDNSVGEFVLWSCTATAQLQKTNVQKNIIHIEPAVVDLTASRSRVPVANSPPRDNDDRINKINIIQINTIPHRSRGRPEAAVPKKPSTENTDHGIKHKSFINPIVDSPLKTIKVNAFRKDMPILFKEKPQLPKLEDIPIKEDQNLRHSSEITVIKPLNNNGK